jgi:hypothetical protein
VAKVADQASQPWWTGVANSQADTFADVSQLPDAVLRELLDDASSIRRLWAVWALGLRAGRSFAPEVSARIDREPDAGLRRHMAVLLAGDRVALEVLAESDPDERVRSTAYGLLLRTAGPHTLDSVAEHLLMVARRDPSACVRAECLRALTTRPTGRSVKEIAPCLDDAELTVREVAADLLLASGAWPERWTVLAEAAAREADEHERRRLWRILAEAGQTHELLAALTRLAPGDRARTVAAFATIGEAGQRATWGALAPFASWQDPRADKWILELASDPPTLGLDFLLSRAPAALDPGHDHVASAVGLRALWALASRGDLHVRSSEPLGEAERAVVEQLLAELAREEATIRTRDADEDWFEEEVERLVDLQAGLRRLL